MPDDAKPASDGYEESEDFISYDVVVVGAGFSGIFSAISLAKQYRVLLVEAEDEVLPKTSSSVNECYKLHTGMHYIGDKNTALLCLKNAIYFAKKYSTYICDADNLKSPMRRGRHFIMSNSLVEPHKALELAETLKSQYKTLCLEDSSNEVFGPPESFIEILPKSAYDYVATSIPFESFEGKRESIHVVLGIETAESQIDIEKLRQHLIETLFAHPNIVVMTKTRALSIENASGHLGYVLLLKNQYGENVKMHCIGVVNCTWQNIELLDATLGAYVPDIHRVNRIKVSLKVKLPKRLRHLNTSTFSCGPYCSMTLLPHGEAILTSEPSTNVGYFAALGEPPTQEMTAFLKTLSLEHPAGVKLAKNILNECARYLKPEFARALKSAALLSLGLGYVKLMSIQEAYTPKALYAADSMIHERCLNGVEVLDLGYISNSGMKMTYTAANAEIVYRELNQHLNFLHRANYYLQLLQLFNQSLDCQFKYLIPTLSRLIVTQFQPLILEMMLCFDIKSIALIAPHTAVRIKKKLYRMYAKTKGIRYSPILSGRGLARPLLSPYMLKASQIQYHFLFQVLSRVASLPSYFCLVLSIAVVSSATVNFFWKLLNRQACFEIESF